VLDADAQKGVEEADGVLRDELFERDQERGTESQEAVDGSWAAGLC